MTSVEIIAEDDVLVIGEADNVSVALELGDQGPPGLPGEPGPPSTVPGPPGPPGAAGTSLIYGIGPPLPQTGHDGDFYIDTQAHWIYGPKQGSWPPGTSLVGPQGPQGIQGYSVLYGATDPIPTFGRDGDFYINTTTHFLSGPKTAGTWPPGTSMIGPAGAQGPRGNSVLYGTLDPTGGVGIDGDFYINTTDNFLFGPKAAGAWPTGISIVGPVGPQGPQGPQGLPGTGGGTGGGGASVLVSDTPPVDAPDNSLWWEADTGLLYIKFNDGDSTQWIQAVPVPSTAGFIAKSGDTMGGPLILNADPTVPLGAATKQMVDAASSGISAKVSKSGDTMSGNLTITKADAKFTLNKTASGQGVGIGGQLNGKDRWTLSLGDGNAETGGGAGSGVALYRYDDSGTFVGTAMTVDRANGETTLWADLHINKLYPGVILDGTASGGGFIKGTHGAVSKWQCYFGAAGAGDFQLYRFNDGGGLQDAPFQISRASGMTSVTALTSASYVDAKSDANAEFNFRLTSGTLKARITWGNAFPALRFYYGMSTGLEYQTYTDPSNGAWYFPAGCYKPGGGVFLDSSDERIKNVEGDYARGLDEIVALRPVVYTFKGNDTPDPVSATAGPPSEDELQNREGIAAPYGNSNHYNQALAGTKFAGLVAQELEAIFPELVKQREGYLDGELVTDLRDIDTSPLIFALINAVKTLTARVAALESGAAR